MPQARRSFGREMQTYLAGQKKAHPAHAAIILSLEAVFAALGGWLILGEVLSPRGMAGAGLMLAGMMISQLLGKVLNNNNGKNKSAKVHDPTLTQATGSSE